MAKQQKQPLSIVSHWQSSLAKHAYNLGYSNDGYRAMARYVMDARKALPDYMPRGAEKDLKVMIALQDVAYALHSGNDDAIKLAKHNLNNCALWRKLSPNEKQFIRKNFNKAFGINYRTGKWED